MNTKHKDKAIFYQEDWVGDREIIMQNGGWTIWTSIRSGKDEAFYCLDYFGAINLHAKLGEWLKSLQEPKRIQTDVDRGDR